LKRGKKNMKNLSDVKVLYVIKGCLKNLARAKAKKRKRFSDKCSVSLIALNLKELSKGRDFFSS